MTDRTKYLSPDAETVTNEAGASQSYLPWRFDLVDPDAFFAMTEVLGEGAKKYGEDNWRAIEVKDHLNHLITHAYAALAGDTSDSHFSHMMCRAMMATAVHMREDAMKDSDTSEPESVGPILLLIFDQDNAVSLALPASETAFTRGCNCHVTNEIHSASCTYLLGTIDSVGYNHRSTAKQVRSGS